MKNIIAQKEEISKISKRYTFKFTFKFTIIQIFFFCLAYLFLCRSACAEYGLALGYGVNSNLYAVRVSLQVDSSLCLDNDIWPATGYWEGSANYISTKKNHGNNQSHIKGLSLAYVLHFEKKDSFCMQNMPYAEFGLGGALFDRNVIADRRLGSSGLFEIKMGAGMRFGEFKEYDLSYKFIHYSNAYLKRPNEGLNLNFIIFSYLF